MSVTAATGAPQLPSHLDPFRAENLDDPYPLYAQMRDLGPAVYCADRDVWFVSTYAAVSDVLRNYRAFVSGLGTSYIRVSDSGFRFPFIDNDPPEHTRVRRSVQRQFSRNTIEEMRPDVQSIVEQLLAAPVAQQHADVVSVLSRRLPDLTIRKLTGIEPPSSEKMADWADAVFHILGPDPDPRYLELTLESLDWLAAEGVPAMPAHCLGRNILEQGGDSGALAAEGTERLYALASIWTAGVDTTNSLLSNMLYAFATNPDQWDAVRADPSLADQAVEEVLRWDSPIRVFLRRTTTETDLQGVTIPADANVCAMFPAANRDPSAFENADAFDVTAARKKTHVAFGASIHMCLGAPVARLEAVEVIRFLAKRVSRIELDGQPVRATSRVIRNFSYLPIRFVPAGER